MRLPARELPAVQIQHDNQLIGHRADLPNLAKGDLTRWHSLIHLSIQNALNFLQHIGQRQLHIFQHIALRFSSAVFLIIGQREHGDLLADSIADRLQHSHALFLIALQITQQQMQPFFDIAQLPHFMFHNPVPALGKILINLNENIHQFKIITAHKSIAESVIPQRMLCNSHTQRQTVQGKFKTVAEIGVIRREGAAQMLLIQSAFKFRLTEQLNHPRRLFGIEAIADLRCA